MFNGYEMWKPDVEKCTKYRLGNMRGSACGRCMKTCPYNVEGVLAERPFQWAAMKLPFARAWIARLDDKLGRGEINQAKKWWVDIEASHCSRPRWRRQGPTAWPPSRSIVRQVSQRRNKRSGPRLRESVSSAEPLNPAMRLTPGKSAMTDPQKGIQWQKSEAPT